MANILRRVGIASLIAIAAVFLWARRVSDRQVATAPVVVVQKDMPEGATIDRRRVVVAQWPVGTVPPDAFRSIDSVAGRITRVPMFKGEVLVPGRLAPVARARGLEVNITPGKRAMAFRFNDVSGIAGLIGANSHVDILLVTDSAGKGRIAGVFMENMRVLAIGSVSHRGPDGAPITAAVATIEVTPDEGERLALATARGQIQLMLRGYGDRGSTLRRGGAGARDLLAYLDGRPSLPALIQTR